ncbi:hypothetical protein E1293_20575 [Actinomadura darangshiensis]|uniref:Uncharacterized protein n=1 Tax=Actinomadura darangshiensis TaxID=705336 RepID=A0A4R5B767_9ACTN|nr:hypothetical protein [Actinomadura darangshiensis]TDD80510.1 hypothetical protein E1293_20575 [Actinomadura darangshiensis]
MPTLYEALAWTMDEPGPSRSYVFRDGDEVLANAARVPVQRQDQGSSVPYADPHAQYDETRVVVCVAAPDGSPYFYVDRTNDPMRPQPAFVVAAAGGLIGSIAVATGGVKGVFSLMSGKSGGRYTLLDAQQRPLATLTGPGLRDPKAEGAVTDASGTEIARVATDVSPYNDRRRRRSMRVHQPLPEPLHTLVLASLVGVELMTPAT